MTAPRTFLDDPRMAKAFGLSTPAQPTGPTHPEPMNIPQTEQEMAAWMQRGGKVNPSQALGGETQTPNGLYGGEFSDEDWAAFKEAARKLDSARGAAKLAPLLERLHAASRQTPDATAINPRQYGENALSAIHSVALGLAPFVPGSEKPSIDSEYKNALVGAPRPQTAGDPRKIPLRAR